MKTLIEQVAELIKHHNKIIKANPSMSNIWWEIRDVDVQELEAYAKKKGILRNLKYCEYGKCMQLLATNLPASLTLFIKSKQCIVKTTTQIIYQ